MVEKYKDARDKAYTDGLSSYTFYLTKSYFRDFLAVYLCEGYKRNRNMVQITNSDPSVIRLCYPFVKNHTNRKLSYFVHIHHDDNEKSVVKFWSELLEIDPSDIRVYLREKKLTTRKGKLPYGIFTFRVGDTYLRCRIEAWINCLKKEWSERRDSNP